MIAAEPEYARGLAAPPAGRAGRLRLADGATRPLAFGRFLGPLTDADGLVLDRARPPVLDVGCGPGRHVQELALRGVVAMGLDASPAAVGIARDRGTSVHHGSVFDVVPGAGEWGCVLLLDGNIGIGGCPVRLLRRVGALLRPWGSVLVEVDPPGWPTGEREVRIENAGGISAPFAWAVAGADGIGALAEGAGFADRGRFAHDGRWFAELEAPPAGGRRGA